MGQWKRPPCALCARPVEVSHRTEQPVMFLRQAKRWAHWGCYRKAKDIRVEIDRLGDRGWKSVGQVFAEIQDEWEEYRYLDV